MLKGLLLSNRVLLLALWSVDVCLAAAGRKSGEVTPNVSSDEDNRGSLSLMSLSAPVKYDEENARRLALSVLERCERGKRAVSECLRLSVRSSGLEPRLDEIARLLTEWRAKLEGPDFSVEDLNSHCKAAYDASISNFENALVGQFGGRMKIVDFFPSLSDSEKRMQRRSTSLSSLEKAIMWDHDKIATRRNKYDALASKILKSALPIKELLLENMEKDSEWKHLVEQQGKLFGNARGSNEGLDEAALKWEDLLREKSKVLEGDEEALKGVAERLQSHMEQADVLMQDHKTLLEVITKNQRDIDGFALRCLATNDGER